MPYTFGAATGDDVTFTTPNPTGGTGFTFVSGWWRPTTLTATRKLWSTPAAGIFGAEIDTTTSSVRLKTDNATTDGVWTAPAELVVNEWTFLAICASMNIATPTAVWKVFSGKADRAPIEQTVTVVTAMAGAGVSAQAAFYIGNAGTGTLAFQGDIADVCVIGETATGDNGIASIAAHGAAWTAAADYAILNRIVLPAWEGDYGRLARLRPANLNLFGLYGYWAGEGDGTTVESPFGRVTATVTGATRSVNGAPRPKRSGVPLDHLIGRARSSS